MKKVFFNIIRRPKTPTLLFGGQGEVFKEIVGGASTYFEYGCGESTLWVFRNTSSLISSVDTSLIWIKKVEQQLGFSDRANLLHVDLGELGRWGRPLSYDHEKNFECYTDVLWAQKKTAEVVLVDGRFRVACFLTSLINANKGTSIIFDDYVNRKNYHYVERFIRPDIIFGRQAVFIVPELSDSDRTEVQKSISKFRYVMD